MIRWEKIRTVLFISLALAATVAGGIVHGYWQQRWGDPAEVAIAVERLGTSPSNFGPWKLVQATTLSDTERHILQNYGYIGGLYQHADSGQRIQFSVLLGPSGPTSVHTPEICLGSHALVATGQRQAMSVTDSDARFWTLTFRTNDVARHSLRAVYGWRFDDTWSASQQPRIAFAGAPYLYKLQLVCYEDDDTSLETCDEFLKSALSELNDRMR